MEEVRVRPALSGEATAISALALRSKGHWAYDAAFLEACRAELTTDPGECDGRHVYVAERDGMMLGYYKLAGDPPVGELADLFVDPPAIGTGVGTLLLRHAIGQARVLGLQRLTIDAEPEAEAFYLRAGAVRTGSVPSGSIPGRELPQLELRLSD